MDIGTYLALAVEPPQSVRNWKAAPLPLCNLERVKSRPLQVSGCDLHGIGMKKAERVFAGNGVSVTLRLTACMRMFDVLIKMALHERLLEVE